MSKRYLLSNICILLTEGFSEAELRDFCFDTPEFRPVHHELAELTGKATIVRHLLEFAGRRELLDSLLAWANEQNPAQYTKHQPYETQTRTSEATLPAVQPTSARPLRVFLCHASADKPAVSGLYQRLNQEGFIQPWLDEEELLPGQVWDTEIRKAVRASDVVLVCLSPHSITKAGYVQKEIKFALDIADEQPEGTIFLIPLRLEPCDVPERLSRWHWANLYETRGYERLLRALRLRAEAIRVHVTLRPQPEESPSTTITSHLDETQPPHVILRPQAEESPPTQTESNKTERNVKPFSVVTPPPALDTPAVTSANKEPPASPGTLHFVQRDMPPATPTPPDRLTLTQPIHLELVRVPAGEFFMGSDPAKDKNAQEDEQPQHRVYVSSFTSANTR